MVGLPIQAARFIAVLVTAGIACQGAAVAKCAPQAPAHVRSACSERGHCCCAASQTESACRCAGDHEPLPLAPASGDSAHCLKLALEASAGSESLGQPAPAQAAAIPDELGCPPPGRSLQTLLCIWRT